MSDTGNSRLSMVVNFTRSAEGKLSPLAESHVSPTVLLLTVDATAKPATAAPLSGPSIVKYRQSSGKTELRVANQIGRAHV